MQKNNENNGATNVLDLLTESDLQCLNDPKAKDTVSLIRNETGELIKSTKGCLRRLQAALEAAQKSNDEVKDTLLIELGRQFALAGLKSKQLYQYHAKIQVHLSSFIYTEGFMGTLWAEIHDRLTTLMYLAVELDKLIVSLTENKDLYAKMNKALSAHLNKSASAAQNGLEKLKRYQLEKSKEFAERYSQQDWYISHKAYYGHKDWNYIPTIKVLMRQNEDLPAFMSLTVQREIAKSIEAIESITPRGDQRYDRKKTLFEELLEKIKGNDQFLKAELLGISLLKTEYQNDDYELFAYIECKSKDVLPELVKVEDNISEGSQILRASFNNQYKFKDLPVYLKITG